MGKRNWDLSPRPENKDWDFPVRKSNDAEKEFCPRCESEMDLRTAVRDRFDGFMCADCYGSEIDRAYDSLREER